MPCTVRCATIGPPSSPKETMKVEVRITGRHSQIGPKVRTYANDKLLPLSRYYDRTRQLEVVFDETNLGWQIEVIAHLQRGKPLVATTKHKDPMAAVDLAHDKLERLLTREKEKQRARRHRDGRSAPAGSAAPPAASEEE
jgi:ribosomal subunit interface protein